MNDLKEIEKSIRKKFHKELFSSFTKALNAYHLLDESDTVYIKLNHDVRSILVSLLFLELLKHRKFVFTVKLIPDENETTESLKNIITHFDFHLDENEIEENSKVCLLTTYDEVLTGILSNVLFQGEVKAKIPKEEIDHKTYISPLYLIKNSDLNHFLKYHELENLGVYLKEDESEETVLTKDVIKKLMDENPYVEGNLFRSIENVNLRTITGYTKDEKYHEFHEWYEQENV